MKWEQQRAMMAKASLEGSTETSQKRSRENE